MKLVPTDTIEKNSPLVQIMGWRQVIAGTNDEPVSHPLLLS